MEDSNTFYRRTTKKFMARGEFVSIVGKIVSTTPESCVLDVGKGGDITFMINYIKLIE